MGYALIVGGGTDGRYTISLDIGEAERAALVARFTTAQAAAQDKLAAAQAELNTKTAELDAATTAYNDATALYIGVLRNEVVVEDEEAYLEIVNGHAEAQAAYIRARAAHAAALANKNALSFSAAHLTKALAAWQAQVLTETREAWCTDFTEDATGYVATLEIPGESDLILIAPGGRSPVLATDGYLRSRGLMSPPQAYFNAAVLPGWQKFKPTYRWGTVTELDEDADTATVALAEARSSAQRLLVNQAATLANVPVEYMECNAEAFEVGDRVVVEFQGQDWAAPRVVGFVDNPKPCIYWPDISINHDINYETISAGGGSAPNWFRMIYTCPGGDLFGFPSSEMSYERVLEFIYRYDPAEWLDGGDHEGFSINEISVPAPISFGLRTVSLNAIYEVPESSPARAMVASAAGLVAYDFSFSSVELQDDCDDIPTARGFNTANVYNGQTPNEPFMTGAASAPVVLWDSAADPREEFFGLPSISVTYGSITKEYVFSHWQNISSSGSAVAVFTAAD